MVMSWPRIAQVLKSIEVVEKTLVIKLDQEASVLIETKDYRPPKFLVFKLPAWQGPVRVRGRWRAQFHDSAR